MFIEIHMLQNFAPSNLNRDDTGSPKDCEFGGYRRARISSQCLKRAVRDQFKANQLASGDQLAVRTKRLVDEELVPRLTAHNHTEDDSRNVATAALRAIGLDFDKKNPTQTEYLLFFGTREVDALVTLCLENWDDLSGGKIKAESMKKAWGGQLDGGKAADLALFGRMLADLPERNIDAASQVAHAISTNRVSIEFDFFTAVDDLRPEETSGAGMMGTVEFNSACFYRYANIDTEQLARNLGGDGDLLRATIAGYLRALKDAIPTGKQNSMAAQNPPSFILVVVRDHGLWSLANAYLNPVRSDGRGDLILASQQAMDRYWDRLSSVYGTEGIRGAAWIGIDEQGIDSLASHQADNFDELVERTLSAAFSQNAEARVI